MPRPRKPTAALKLHGSYRADRHSEPEPEAVGVLSKPDGLDSDSEWFWGQHVEQVVANGGGGGDLAILLSACEWWSQYKRAREAVAKKLEYRAFCMMSMAWKNFNVAASRLGLSPTERAKLRIQPKPKESDFSKFLKRKRG